MRCPRKVAGALLDAAVTAWRVQPRAGMHRHLGQQVELARRGRIGSDGQLPRSQWTCSFAGLCWRGSETHPRVSVSAGWKWSCVGAVRRPWQSDWTNKRRLSLATAAMCGIRKRDTCALGAKCKVEQVETDVVAPVKVLSRDAEYAVRTIRPKIDGVTQGRPGRRFYKPRPVYLAAALARCG
jgi:hypothetical protein